ncbi:hypothetical protein E3O11_16915 [Cryobacterium levicorallinum]|uniref:Uncharacterized protein n=1 Tax=Cryobacterium levicorallinum TaxID=995038 RepID=A0A1I3BTA8_9MICO|nr:hypothetical protein [Cryobacterium levicorallinum]TFB81335.1 hypothetical protein E3O11_16915 [Cryobacterium levicorallinum]GEP28328.1 hypothetical protein CLE01_29260 [Cryobacterium levicorallinum]SFH64981.1 hypothetical protein SAMN05216274_110101 [Cryobacterium levicorallinum]
MGNLSAWEAVLEDLELRVDAAARSIMGVTDGGRSGSGVAGSSASAGSLAVSASSTSEFLGANVLAAADSAANWTPPWGLGAIPAELVERVRDLLHNQHKLIGELETARNLTAKHLAAVRAVPPKHDARASVYLDVAG